MVHTMDAFSGMVIYGPKDMVRGTLTLILYYLCFSAAASCSLQFTVTRWAPCLEPRKEFLTLHGLSVEQCMCECAMRPDCESLGYKSKGKLATCQMHFEVGLHEKIGDGANTCAFFRRRDMDLEEIDTVCTCSYGQTCGLNTGQCVFKECKRLTLINGYVYGNTRQLNSRVRIRCDDGFVERNGIVESTCTLDGNWSYSPSCILQPLTTTTTMTSTKTTTHDATTTSLTEETTIKVTSTEVTTATETTTKETSSDEETTTKTIATAEAITATYTTISTEDTTPSEGTTCLTAGLESTATEETTTASEEITEAITTTDSTTSTEATITTAKATSTTEVATTEATTLSTETATKASNSTEETTTTNPITTTTTIETIVSTEATATVEAATTTELKTTETSVKTAKVTEGVTTIGSTIKSATGAEFGTVCPAVSGDWVHPVSEPTFDVMFSKTNVKQAAASTECEKLGSGLVKIDVEWKQSFLADSLFNCAGYSSTCYWIDGTIVGSTWHFSDLSAMPTDTGLFWHTGEPRTSGVGCVAIDTNQRWVTKNCNNKCGYICELLHM